MADVRLLPISRFKSLSTQHQKTYLTELRQALVNFEKSLNSKTKFSMFSLFPTAHAGWNNKCVIGGVIRSTGTSLCPTHGRSCEDKEDGFMCGLIFGNTCIDRLPIEDISDRCLNYSKPVDTEKYQAIKEEYESLIDEVCSETNEKTQNPCEVVKRRITEIRAKVTPQAKVTAEKCKPNPTKYKSIIDDRSRCGGGEFGNSLSTINLYNSLAEIASCDRYEVTSIGDPKKSKFGSAKECVVNLQDPMGTIANGEIKIRFQNQQEYDLVWDPDENPKVYNQADFWKNQFIPQMEDRSPVDPQPTKDLAEPTDSEKKGIN